MAEPARRRVDRDEMYVIRVCSRLDAMYVIRVRSRFDAMSREIDEDGGGSAHKYLWWPKPEVDAESG